MSDNPMSAGADPNAERSDSYWQDRIPERRYQIFAAGKAVVVIRLVLLLLLAGLVWMVVSAVKDGSFGKHDAARSGVAIPSQEST